ncbi:hypothetical protein [Niallia sp. 03133]|uniref:hypothetical protein n=1 Tax=Niallia sp. 03133 TaxID=3458060 RepID=UPI004044EAF6
MRKAILISLSLTFISSLLFGCQNITTETAVNPTTKTENNKKLSINSDFIASAFQKQPSYKVFFIFWLSKSSEVAI